MIVAESRVVFHRKKPHLVIGLMSGTSYDGITAALAAIRGRGLSMRVELLAHATFPYSNAAKKVIAEVSSPPTGTVDLICRANFLLGELFAEAAIAIARRAGVPLSRIGLIGSHGQTIHHLPEPALTGGRMIAGTLQIAEPSIIAERTGVTTVADFRPRDMACGGQGAPLVPYVDYLLFRHRRRGRVLLNIGGIANVTYLPPACRPDQVAAFDTGPGNMLLDALARVATLGRHHYDRDGALAAKGSVRKPLLARWLRHPFFRLRPPKSTGRETFGYGFVQRILHAAGDLPEEDLLATATALTATTIHQACERFIRPLGPLDEVIASGGGCHNLTLMRRLAEAFAPVPVRTTDDFGIPVDAKEALAFAILAHETLAGRPGNLPSATGASRPVVLGKIVPGRRGLCR
jgi:anhydro-N-acetylmuramic acid kinase